MNDYKGMNFREWCAIDEKDERKICYDKTPYGKFTSEDFAPCSISEIASCYIKNIALINDEWHLHLVRSKSYANK